MIIPASLSDIATIVNLMESFYLEENYLFNKTKTIRNLELFIDNNSLGKIFKLHLAPNTVGYAVIVDTFCFELGGKVGYIDELYVVEEFRGQGMATQFLSEIKCRYKLNQYAALRLEVERMNPEASKLYERIGFKSHSRDLMSLGLE